MSLRGWMGAALLLITSLVANAQPRADYPADYAATINAARKEGTLVIYATTDLSIASYLIRDFKSLYPGVEIDYRDLNSVEVYNRFLKEVNSRAATADVLWSSAMDLQVKLVNDGYALHYESPEIPNLPKWAVWKSEAYGTTFEPMVFAYNKRELADHQVPRNHRELVQMLGANPERFKGRVITYDLENSGLGFLCATQDAKTSHEFWDVARVLGQNRARLVTSTASMLESVASGQSVLAYNLLGSYAHAKARHDPSVGVVYPNDYTLVVSRVAFINRRAAHPNAARLWLDYLLSRRGQTVLANQAELFTLRDDIEGDANAAGLARTAGRSLKPIAIGPSLMANLDRTKRQEFLTRWRQALTARP